MRPGCYIRSMGCLTPHGLGLPPAGASCPLRRAPAVGGRELPSPVAGWIDPIPRPERWLGRRATVRFGRLDRLTRLALVAANAAMEGASPPSPEEAGLALGTAFGSHLANEAFQLALERGPQEEASPTIFTYTLPSSSVGEISIHFGLKGPALTLAEGIGAGLAALGLATRIVEQGEAPWMLSGAADTLGPTLLAARPGPTDPPLAEGAAFVSLAGDPGGALARVAATAQGRGVGEVEGVALERAGLPRDRLLGHLVFRDAGSPLAAAHGRSGAASPLLGACASIHERRLPALITAADPSGAIDCLCLDRPDATGTRAP